ncbi:Putative 5'(3')-deoxyribonucleotidase [Marinomonas spartinae]|nr:Putative 5'(3')-deoxyribonucleotidase [Marinomonas spartinae]
MRKRIAIDMDETVCDSLGRHIEWYNKQFSTQLTKEDTAGTRIYHVVPVEHMAAVKSYPHHPDFFRDLMVFDDAIESIKTLSEQYDIFFVTAAMEYPTSFQAKYEWLKKHFPFIHELNYVFCGDKSIINADYLIDDTPKHLATFDGKGLLFHAFHNMYATDFQRVYSWKEVLETLRLD